MWLLTCLTSGFHNGGNVERVQLYRLVIGIAVCWKAAVSATRGNWRRLEVGSFDRWRLADRTLFYSRSHKPLLVLRIVAGAALAWGVWPVLAIVVLVVGHAHEYRYDRHFHTVYLTGCLLALLFATRLGSGWHFSPDVDASDTFARFLIVLLTVDMYLNSGYLKLRSQHFRSGRYLAQVFRVADAVRDQQPTVEYWQPALLSGRGEPFWRVCSVAVIAVELALPVLLSVPQLRPAGIVLGCACHLVFLLILPFRLLPFSLASVASYLLF